MDTATASSEKPAPPKAEMLPESEGGRITSENKKQELPERSKPPKPRKEKTPKPAKVPKGPMPPKPKREVGPAPNNDPDSMFKVGFLADVYAERPSPRVVTRFPPEPNGYLHIGHSKAIAINFGFARYHGGECYLRFDDTNPAGEKKEFDDSIEETVRWLGFSPAKFTHSSDNFDRLYELAETLILKDGAYVCHCTSEYLQSFDRYPREFPDSMGFCSQLEHFFELVPNEIVPIFGLVSR